MKYDDNPQTIDQLLQLLKSKGLRIDDENFARQKLLSIGYFKLRGYFGKFIATKNDANYTFIKNVFFEDIIDVYDFDSSLRISVFEAIVGVEVALKSVINDTMSIKFGSHWYLNGALFKKEFHFQETDIQTEEKSPSGYEKFISEFRGECNNHRKNTEDSPIKRYCGFYTDPDLPPSWMMLDVLSFGKVSILYQNILDGGSRTQIAHYFKTHDKLLQSWLRAISYLRNLCAHHSRITYRNVKPPPSIPKKESNIFLKTKENIDASKLYFVLCCIQYLSIKADTGSVFSSNLRDIINFFPTVDLTLMGFTTEWEDEEIWK